MVDHKKEDILISKLLEETYSFVPKNDVSLSAKDLYKYFTTQAESLQKEYSCHLVEYVSQLSCEMVTLDWQEETKCYRFTLNGEVIDIPSNWGPFENYQSEGSSVLYLKKSNDEHLFNEVMSSMVGRKVETIFFTDTRSQMHLSFIEVGVDADLDKIIELSDKWNTQRAA